MFSRQSRRNKAALPAQPVLERHLRALIDEHSTAAFHVAYGILHDRGLAEDVVQETMIKAWQTAESFRGESSVRTWVLRIAHNTAIDSLRRRRDQLTAVGNLPEIDNPVGPNETERRVEGLADLELLSEALRSLDETSRTIVILREVELMSYQQISDALGLSVPTVKTRLLRARRFLQAAVREEREEKVEP